MSLFSLALLYYSGYKLTKSLLVTPKKDYSASEFRSNILFNDIYGLEKAKVELGEIIDYLKDPLKYILQYIMT